MKEFSRVFQIKNFEVSPPDLIKVAHTLDGSAPSQHNKDAFLLIANVLESRALMSLNSNRPSFPHIDACPLTAPTA